MTRYILILWLVALACGSLRDNEVKVVQAFERIEGASVSLARSEWKNYLNLDAKVPMEYSIFKVRIKGNADAVKRAKIFDVEGVVVVNGEQIHVSRTFRSKFIK